MTGEKDLFTSLETDDIPKETIVLGDNSKGEVIGLGKIAIAHNNSINDVYWVEKAPLLDGCSDLLCRDGRDDFYLLLRFFLVWLLLFRWLLLCNTAVRRNIFDIDHVAYLEAWMKLELACGAIDVELYLPLANVDVEYLKVRAPDLRHLAINVLQDLVHSLAPP